MLRQPMDGCNNRAGPVQSRRPRFQMEIPNVILTLRVNHPAATNPAITARCQAGRHLRRFVDRDRWALRSV